MAWEDKPTEAQLDALFNLTNWALPVPLAKQFVKEVGETWTRKQVSEELGYLRNLKIAKKPAIPRKYTGMTRDELKQLIKEEE